MYYLLRILFLFVTGFCCLACQQQKPYDVYADMVPFMSSFQDSLQMKNDSFILFFKEQVSKAGDRPEGRAALQKAEDIHKDAISLREQFNNYDSDKVLQRDCDAFVASCNQKTGLRIPNTLLSTYHKNTLAFQEFKAHISHIEMSALKELFEQAKGKMLHHPRPYIKSYTTQPFFQEGKDNYIRFYLTWQRSMLQCKIDFDGNPADKISNGIGYLNKVVQNTSGKPEKRELKTSITVNNKGTDTTFTTSKYYWILPKPSN